ncbi:hypothetical protein C5E51_23225 [Nocardia nova]|nr:hypothetical protein C5E51_23225 [Nocardia nova]
MIGKKHILDRIGQVHSIHGAFHEQRKGIFMNRLRLTTRATSGSAEGQGREALPLIVSFAIGNFLNCAEIRFKNRFYRHSIFIFIFTITGGLCSL